MSSSCIFVIVQSCWMDSCCVLFQSSYYIRTALYYIVLSYLAFQFELKRKLALKAGIKKGSRWRRRHECFGTPPFCTCTHILFPTWIIQYASHGLRVETHFKDHWKITMAFIFHLFFDGRIHIPNYAGSTLGGCKGVTFHSPPPPKKKPIAWQRGEL